MPGLNYGLEIKRLFAAIITFLSQSPIPYAVKASTPARTGLDAERRLFLFPFLKLARGQAKVPLIQEQEAASETQAIQCSPSKRGNSMPSPSPARTMERMPARFRRRSAAWATMAATRTEVVRWRWHSRKTLAPSSGWKAEMETEPEHSQAGVASQAKAFR